MSRSIIRGARVVKLDLDYVCKEDLANGKGIRIQSTEAFHKSDKVEDGLQSPFFGSDFSDEESYSQRFRCKCGDRIGKMYEHTICPKCGFPVEYIDVEIDKTGWIITDHFKVLSPIYAEKLAEALGTVEGEKVLTRIIHVDYEDNDRPINQIEKENELKKKHPFIGKGMRWLVDHIKEVLDYYSAKKPNKAALFNELYEDSDKLFTHCIPVYSSVLRLEQPGEKDKKLYKLRINTIYQSLIRSSNAINELGNPVDMTEVELDIVDRHLYQMHLDILQLFTEVFNILNGKKGVIASRVISGRWTKKVMPTLNLLNCGNAA